MKTIFMWGWKDYAMAEDTLMSRERMAKLMRAWRRAKTQGAREFKFILIKKSKCHREYLVATTKYYPIDFHRFSISTV